MKAPTNLVLHRKSRRLEVRWPDARTDHLAFEYLRVYSPSAEVRGHGGGEPVLVPGKRDIDIERVEPVGHYAVRLHFSDRHSSGLYSWSVLDELARNREAWWNRYLERLDAEGLSRDSDVTKLSALGSAPRKWTPGSTP